MMLKAALVLDQQAVFDKKTGKSIGFDNCVNLDQPKPSRSTRRSRGRCAPIDAMRNEELPWYTVVDERLLYLYTRAAVTLFDDLLHRVFGEPLSDHMPLRVLPTGLDPSVAGSLGHHPRGDRRLTG